MYMKEIDFTPEQVIDYLRKSQSDDPLLTVQEVLEKHESILDEWAQNHLGAKVPEENKYREVVSGETLKERPEIQKVLKRIESPKIKAVKVVEPQRLTRGDLEDIGRLMKLLKHTNTFIITPERIYDLKDEYDWNAFEAELKRGNDYLKYTKKILSRGRLLSVSQGNYIGSIPPYGYTKTTIQEGKRKCPTLAINEKEAKVVRMIFDMYVNEDMGRPNICNTLDNLGIKPPKGEHWSPAGLKDMLENVHYIGKVKWNWRKTVTVVENSEIIQTRPKAKAGEYLIYDGKHEAIISEELFNKAREKQGRNHRAKPTTKLRNPFASLLYCQCGRAMSLKSYKKEDGTERCLPRLCCDGQKHCHMGSCTLEDVTVTVEKTLKECIENFEVCIANSNDNLYKLQLDLIKQLKQRQKELEKKEISQWEKYSEEGMPKHIFDKLNEKVQKEKEEVREALKKAEEAMPNPIDYEEKLAKFKVALEALRKQTVDNQTKNRLLKACISKMVYSRAKPERMTKEKADELGIKLNVGGKWTDPEIKLNIELRL